MHTKIDLLVPVELLPDEGGDIAPFQSRNGAPTAPELLKYYLAITGNSELRYRVSQDGIEPSEAGNEYLPMQHSRFGVNGNHNGQPFFDLSAASTHLDLEPILANEEGVDFHRGEKAGAEDYLRTFLEHFTTRMNVAVRGYAGTPIPLLRWSKEENGEGVIVQFCGVVLADKDLLESMRDGENREGGVSFDGALGLVLEEAEIEGRGMREVAATLGVLGIVLASAPSADAGLFSRFKEKGVEQAAKTSPGVVHVVANRRQAPAKVDRALLQNSDSGASQVIVDVARQRAYVLVDGKVAIDTPISTARSGKYTPRGTFEITQRVREGKTSTIYGCELPCWMRLGESAIGMHVGDLPGYPASAGCVRLPRQIAPLVFEATERGTTVKVVDSWEPPAMMVASL